MVSGRILRAIQLAVGAALVAGCAQIPTSSPVLKGPTPDEGAGPVSIDAQRPQPGARPQDIVQGFLDAMSSYEFGFPIARTYLAPDIEWNPTTTIVYGAGENLTVQADGSGVIFTAPKIATIDDTGRYLAAAPADVITVSIRLAKVFGEWRIATPPTWLLISTLERDANYGQYLTYYPALETAMLVPDPVWLPATGDELPALLAEQLVDGPTAALGDAVSTAFPAETRVVDVSIEANNLRVSLTEQALEAVSTERSLMAAQLVYTMSQIVGVEFVTITVNGVALDVPNQAGPIPVAAYANLNPLVGFADPPGYAVSRGRVVTVNPDNGDLQPVPGPAGDGTLFGAVGDSPALPPRTIAVSLDQEMIAGVSADGHVVEVAALAADAEPQAVWNGGDVAQPSWDRDGDLWIAVRPSAEGPSSALWRLRPGEPPIQVDAPDLEGTTVLALRIAPDGVRMAVVVQDAGDTPRLLIGRIQRGDQPALSNFVEIAPQVTSVLDVAWLGENDLAVIGSTTGRQGEPLVISADGSRVQQSVETGTRLIAAFSDQPVLALTSTNDLIRQVSQISWLTVGQATAVTYPG